MSGVIHQQVEKMDSRFLFACTKRELQTWQSVWGVNKLASTIRLLLNTAAAQRLNKKQKTTRTTP